MCHGHSFCLTNNDKRSYICYDLVWNVSFNTQPNWIRKSKGFLTLLCVNGLSYDKT